MPRRNRRQERKRRRATEPAVEVRDTTIDGLAWSLVHRGIASPRILGQQQFPIQPRHRQEAGQ